MSEYVRAHVCVRKCAVLRKIKLLYFFSIWLPGPESDFARDMLYFRGFFIIQDLVERSIIHLQTANDMLQMPTINVQQFPYPCYKTDK